MSETIPIPLLRRLLVLDPDTGKLFWLRRDEDLFADGPRRWAHCKAWNAQFGGKEALIARHSKGYLSGVLHLHGEAHRLLAHRVAFALHAGKWPAGQVDHINGNTQDNRPANLRDIPGALNQRNMAMAKTNTSGVTGVSRTGCGTRWQAYINVNRRRIQLGRFDSFEDAAAARKAAEAAHGFHPNHGRRDARRGALL